MPGQHEELKRAIRSARNIAGISSDQELALRSGVHLQTLQNWMYGNTTPRPSELSKVARALDVPMDDLMAVYEGRQVQPPPLQDALRELVAEMREDRREARESRQEMIRLISALVALAASISGKG